MSGEVDLACLDGQPVKAGEGKDGLPLFIARACYEDGMHPGKVGTQGQLYTNFVKSNLMITSIRCLHFMGWQSG